MKVQRKHSVHASCTTFLLAVAGCGQMKLAPLQGTTSGQASGDLKVDRTLGQKLPTFSLNHATTCHLDQKSRTLRVEVDSQEPPGKVQISVMGLRSTTSDYVCEQGAGNNKNKDELGTPYDGCMVRVAVPAAAHPGGTDVHAMCRMDKTEWLFSYGGRCRVSVSLSDKEVTGTFLCQKMPRITATSAPAADDDDTTLDAEGSFRCTHQKSE